MNAAFLGFSVAAAISLVATPLVRDAAKRRGALDVAHSSRKIHGRAVPRLGGIAIIVAFFGAVGLARLMGPIAGFTLSPVMTGAFLAGGAVIAALGIFDDLRGANARTKFAVQFGVAAAMYWSGFRIETLANPFGPHLELGFLAFPFTLLWIAGIINALNLIDGLDGLAGGVAVVALATTVAVGAQHGRPGMIFFAAVLAGAVLGFLRYNLNPASIFMGDSGSMFLGFVLATLSIGTHQKSTTAVSLLIPIVALGLPIADTLLAMSRRAARGVPMFSADRGHIHHRLLDLGLTHRQTVLVLHGASVLLGCTAIALAHATPAQAFGGLLVLATLSACGLYRLGFFRVENALEVLEARKRNAAMRQAVLQARPALDAAESFDELWRAIEPAARALRAREVQLRLGTHGGPRRLYSSGAEPAASDLACATFGIGGERSAGDELLLGWADGRRKVDRDTEIAVELLCREVEPVLERIRSRVRLRRAIGNARQAGRDQRSA